jgi:TDG/mug DNA glycosylase family protein
MDVLPDILAPGLDVVFCGTAVGECSARRGHYYAGPGNSFWQLLHAAGFTAQPLGPPDDSSLPTRGLGLTDLVKEQAQSHDRGLSFDVPGVLAKVEGLQPTWVAFTGKVAGQAAARFLREPTPRLGLQSWTFGGAQVFVLPSPSGANRRREYDGRATRLEWWAELAQLSVTRNSLPSATNE